MKSAEQLERENKVLRECLSRLIEVSLRIKESLDFDTVLQGVLDSARSLTEARYGVIAVVDDAGQVENFLSSGMTAEEAAQLWNLPGGMRLFEYLGGISAPLRLADLPGHLSSLGLPDLPLPEGAGPGLSYPTPADTGMSSGPEPIWRP